MWKKGNHMPEKKLEIGIIGLGKFGLRMATTLVSLGHTVVGIDMSETRVQLAEETLNSVYRADATNISVLRSLHIQDLDWVVISVGQSVEQSLNVTLNVQELGGPKSWSRPPTRNTARFSSAWAWTAPWCRKPTRRSWQPISLLIRACWT